MSSSCSLAIDLGGTQVRLALVAEGKIIHRAAELTDVLGGPEAVLNQFRSLYDLVCSRRSNPRISGVGISIPGTFDSVSGAVLQLPLLPGWEGFPLAARISELFQVVTFVENDATAAAFGEWKFGAGQGVSNMVYVTVSTGIGGGIVADDRLLRGHRGLAGELGHLPMDLNGPICGCGAKGCFEALASGTAMGNRARESARLHPGSWLGRAAATRVIDARLVVEGARFGDPDCQQQVRTQAELLGQGFKALIHLFSPERIVMGGGVSQAFDILEPGIREVISREALKPYRQVPVFRSALGDDSGLVGVAALAAA